MKAKSKLTAWLPLIVCLALGAGVWLGHYITPKMRSWENASTKFDAVFRLIEDEYVDTLNMDSLIELTIPEFLSRLDPHTVYIPARDLVAVNSELDGSFSGVGISFMVVSDTITVLEVIPGGPAEKVGLMAGDRIVTVNDSTVAGSGITSERVQKLLRGPKDTRVDVGIKRATSPDILPFTITRGDIPVTSVDASYMLNDSVGYVKVNSFGRTTFDEFITSMMILASDGARNFVVDLRGNGGGFLDVAILMVNEFLDARQPIVMTKGRGGVVEQSAYSDGLGSFKTQPVVVLLDEFSASASEIFAGALQDNDRGLIIGRRSFGKGLVQRQITFPDSSAVRLTTSRYYTPSGRCIQKTYSLGDSRDYAEDIVRRYDRGEVYHADSIKFDDALRFSTSTGRTVYGGGGIMPDIFVATDTTAFTQYYFNVVNAGLLQKYSFNYADTHRREFDECTSTDEVLDVLPSDDRLLQSFVSFAAQNGVPARWYYINISRPLLLNQLKALIARDVLGLAAYYEISGRRDPTIDRAVEAIANGEARFPLVDREAE